MGTNIVEFLGGSQDLIGIRSKGEESRIFDRVHALEVEAQKQYQSTLQEVEDRISEVNQEIQQLVTQQQGTGLIVAGPELSEALQRLRENEATLRAERRIIRRELRKDIDALKWKLVSLNIGYSPIGLVIPSLHRMRKDKALLGGNMNIRICTSGGRPRYRLYLKIRYFPCSTTEWKRYSRPSGLPYR